MLDFDGVCGQVVASVPSPPRRCCVRHRHCSYWTPERSSFYFSPHLPGDAVEGEETGRRESYMCWELDSLRQQNQLKIKSTVRSSTSWLIFAFMTYIFKTALNSNKYELWWRRCDLCISSIYHVQPIVNCECGDKNAINFWTENKTTGEC